MTKIDVDRLIGEYATDRGAVRKCAERHNVTVQSVYYQLKRAGVELRRGGDATVGTQAREKNPNWKNGTTRRADGYILERREGRQLFQHRLVAEQKLKRPLRKGECVHHKNGDKSDNRPENLEIYASHAQHMREHCDPQTMRERGIKGNLTRYAALKARG